MRPWWWNTVESRDLVGLSLEDQRKQIEMVKQLNEWTRERPTPHQRARRKGAKPPCLKRERSELVAGTIGGITQKKADTWTVAGDARGIAVREEPVDERRGPRGGSRPPSWAGRERSCARCVLLVTAGRTAGALAVDRLRGGRDRECARSALLLPQPHRRPASVYPLRASQR